MASERIRRILGWPGGSLEHKRLFESMTRTEELDAGRRVRELARRLTSDVRDALEPGHPLRSLASDAATNLEGYARVLDQRALVGLGNPEDILLPAPEAPPAWVLTHPDKWSVTAENLGKSEQLLADLAREISRVTSGGRPVTSLHSGLSLAARAAISYITERIRFL